MLDTLGMDAYLPTWDETERDKESDELTHGDEDASGFPFSHCLFFSGRVSRRTTCFRSDGGRCAAFGEAGGHA